MATYVGCTISLISNSLVRYVGILHDIDSIASTVSLERVICCGTEGRTGNPHLEFEGDPNQVFEFIQFKGEDVKDLQVIDAPPPVAAPPPPGYPSHQSHYQFGGPSPSYQPRDPSSLSSNLTLQPPLNQQQQFYPSAGFGPVSSNKPPFEYGIGGGAAGSLSSTGNMIPPPGIAPPPGSFLPPQAPSMGDDPFRGGQSYSGYPYGGNMGAGWPPGDFTNTYGAIGGGWDMPPAMGSYSPFNPAVFQAPPPPQQQLQQPLQTAPIAIPAPTSTIPFTSTSSQQQPISFGSLASSDLTGDSSAVPVKSESSVPSQAVKPPSPVKPSALQFKQPKLPPAHTVANPLSSSSNHTAPSKPKAKKEPPLTVADVVKGGITKRAHATPHSEPTPKSVGSAPSDDTEMIDFASLSLNGGPRKVEELKWVNKSGESGFVPASSPGQHPQRPPRSKMDHHHRHKFQAKISNQIVPQSDFDFESSNAKFVKPEVGKAETTAANGADDASIVPVKPTLFYSKSGGFFDSISCSVNERLDQAERKHAVAKDKETNLETFGQTHIYRRYHRGGGRGGRGGGRGGRRQGGADATENA